MAHNYWTNVTQQRLPRRRALAAGGAGISAAVLLAACGGGGDGVSGPKDNGGLVTQAKDTTGGAKRGGVLKDHAVAQPRSLDPINPQADLNRIAPHIYGTLLTEKPGKLRSSEQVLQGDAAQSFEFAGDGLQITLKLRPGVKWHNRPPVNGRALTTDDVLFSLNRYEKLAPLRTLIFNAASPDAPLLSATAPDASTIILRLKEPVAYMLNWFATFGSFTGLIIMYPKETDSTFDARQDMIGHGPFQLKEHVPSLKFTLQRNPDYYDKDFALFDGVEIPIITEYAQRLAQFKAGNVHYLTTVRGEDALLVKRDEPRILMYESDRAARTNPITFGHLPLGSSKFVDERVRQAFSMAIDRDLWIDAIYNVDKFEREGLPVRSVWNSHLGFRESFAAGGWWLDPRDEKTFGANAKYFKFDLAEAKKLLAAAGHPRGFDVTWRYPAATQYDLARESEAMAGFWQALGVNVITDAQTDYTGVYIPNNRDASGAFEGIANHSVTGTTPSVIDATSALVAEYWPPSGVTFHGFDVNGKGDKSGDTTLTAILAKARVERDTEARKKLVHDAQRHLGKTQHALIFPGGSSGFEHAWPSAMNFRVWRGTSPWNFYQKWLDQTKPPFTNA